MAELAYAYQDGSTRRHVRRIECQAVCIALREHIADEDYLGILEAWGELRNDAERVFCWEWLAVKQREAIRLAKRMDERRTWRVVLDPPEDSPPGRWHTEEEAASWALAHYADKPIAWVIEQEGKQ